MQAVAFNQLLLLVGQRALHTARCIAGCVSHWLIGRLREGSCGHWRMLHTGNGSQQVVFALICVHSLCRELYNLACRYDGWSYESIMLEPLARVLRRFTAPGGGLRKVYFALQGEMGATVVRYPGQYSALMGRMRAMLRGDDDAPAPAAPTVSTTKDGILYVPSDTPTASSSGVNALLDRVGLGGLSRLVVTGFGRRLAAEGDDVDGGHMSMSKAQQQSGRGGAQILMGLTFNFVYSDGSQVGVCVDGLC